MSTSIASAVPGMSCMSPWLLAGDSVLIEIRFGLDHCLDQGDVDAVPLEALWMMSS